ncbi:hypothetical protein [Sphingomonas sp. Leaf4]|uniref:hypothetical protein n=1 Tax=Sphingomonas sp. Leaf4 TaxID=2876553 RepID=UPI001E650842|nr:hypothetical protein [Sphingomonas sp. Leaf4]
MTSAGQARHILWRRGIDNLLRIVAAMPVGYGVASLWAMALARILPGERSAATITATLIAFVLCAAAVMWAYAARSGWRALWTLCVLGGVAAAITWGSIAIGGRL